MISIIGAGPAGSYLAYLLAKKGLKVRIFEEHEDVGKPVQCTGIVTGDIFKLIKLDESVISNVTSNAVVHSKNKSVDVSAKEVVLHRDKFDKFLLGLAVEAGVELYKKHRYVRFDGKNICFSNGKVYRTDILVGADGPNSAVARTNRLFSRRNFYVGVQARVRLKSKKDSYHVFLGSDFPGFFGWIVPEDENTVRVGIAAKKNSQIVFDNFLDRLRIKDKDIIEKQGGLIPVYDPDQIIQRNNVFLVGDAACMVKASTGGGIIPGLNAAGVLCDCIINKKDYNKEFRKSVGKSLWLHLKVRNMLDNFSDRDHDILLKYIKQRRIRNILRDNTRESPLFLLMKLLFSEPRFLRFLFKL